MLKHKNNVLDVANASQQGVLQEIKTQRTGFAHIAGFVNQKWHESPVRPTKVEFLVIKKFGMRKTPNTVRNWVKHAE
jgi:hypothetical protein